MKTLESHQQSPLVTILIPAFNAEKTIERALRSVLAQRIESFEIVVVNDASNDGTVAEILANAWSSIGHCVST